MNKVFSWIIGVALTILTLHVASAMTLHYTNWGGGLAPSTWGQGTTAMNIQGSQYQTSYYQNYNTAFISGRSMQPGGFSYSASGARPYTTTYYTQPNSNYNYRTYSAGSWQLNSAQATGNNWGFRTGQGANGLSAGNAWFGGYPGYRSGPYYGSSTHLYGPYNQYGSYATYQPTRYGTPYGSYYRSNAATISRGNVYY